MCKLLKKVSFICLAAVCVLSMFVLGGCGKKENGLVGNWYTEKSGVGMTLSFTEDGEMTVRCSVTDKAAADAAGVDGQEIQSRNFSIKYEAEQNPDLSALTAEEQEKLKGKSCFCGVAEDGTETDMVYYIVSGDKLITTQKSGKYDKMSGVPIYDETVFDLVK